MAELTFQLKIQQPFIVESGRAKQNLKVIGKLEGTFPSQFPSPSPFEEVPFMGKLGRSLAVKELVR